MFSLIVVSLLTLAVLDSAHALGPPSQNVIEIFDE